MSCEIIIEFGTGLLIGTPIGFGIAGIIITIKKLKDRQRQKDEDDYKRCKGDWI